MDNDFWTTTKNELWDKIKQNIAIRQRRDTDN